MDIVKRNKLRIEQNGKIYEIENDNLPFTYLKQRGDYLYEIQFDSIPNINNNIPATFGACSTFAKDNKVYRNLDFNYTENASFIVHTPKFKGMSFVDGLHNGKFQDWDMDKVAQLPNRLVDGINDAGLVVTTHLVFNDNLYTSYVGDNAIPIYQIPSLLLSNCNDITNVRNWITLYGSKISIPESMQQNEYTLIFFIKFKDEVYSLQPINGSYGLFDLSTQTIPKLTNFVSLGTDNISKSTFNLQNRPTGLERYNLINSGATLEDLRFTKAYENPDRLSEFIGIDGTTKDSSDNWLTSIYEEAKAIYDIRNRDGQTWQTMHSVIYDLTDKTMIVCVQEDWTKEYNVPEISSSSDSQIEQVEKMIAFPWISTYTYRVNQYALDDNKLYRCLVQNSGQKPSTSPDYWKYVTVGDDFYNISTKYSDTKSLNFFSDNIVGFENDYIFHYSRAVADNTQYPALKLPKANDLVKINFSMLTRYGTDYYMGEMILMRNISSAYLTKIIYTKRFQTTTDDIEVYDDANYVYVRFRLSSGVLDVSGYLRWGFWAYITKLSDYEREFISNLSSVSGLTKRTTSQVVVIN